MEKLSVLKQEWVLTQEALDKLLAELDGERERAGQKYEEIRQKLMKFFKWRGCALPEEYTDKTIDRVARRILGGADLRVKDPYLYFHGVALNVLKEHWKESERGIEAIDDLRVSEAPAVNPFDLKERELEQLYRERRFECLDGCVGRLSPENLALINEYHNGERRAKIERRKSLAKRLNIPLNALRIRAYRIRSELEACVEGCVRRHE